TLSPQEEFEFRRGLHYHRMVGEVSQPTPTSLLELTVTGPSGSTQSVSSNFDGALVNQLITCCKSGNTWDEHVILLRNTGERPATINVQLTFLHDDFAVIAYDAEPGAWWQTLLVSVLLLGIPAWIATGRVASDPGKVRRWVRIGAGSLGAAWGLAGLLSLIGMVRFGGGPLNGSLTAHEPFPVPGFFVNSSLVSALPLITLYEFGLAGWAIAQRHSAHVSRGIRWLGYAGAAGPVVFGAHLVIEYGNPLLATAIAIVPAGLIVAGAHWRRGARGA
ncbi:MAG TPA: hypothetical protein VGB18_07090, partial [Candidatus Thermoplasmatota archaeon]